MYNKKALKVDLGKFKKPDPYKKDIILDPMGQYNHPGEPTRIPSNNITMENVPYPIWAIPNVGQPQMLYPGEDKIFPQADYVDEYPVLRKGGVYLPNKRNRSRYSKNPNATNILFTVNSLMDPRIKRKIFDPRVKYQQGGEYYTYPGSNSVYRKVNGKWQVDTKRDGNFKDLSVGNVKQRIKNLEKGAKLLTDPSYYDMLEVQKTPYQQLPTEKPKSTPSIKTGAQKLFDEKFIVDNQTNYDKAQKQVNDIAERDLKSLMQARPDYLKTKEEQEAWKQQRINEAFRQLYQTKGQGAGFDNQKQNILTEANPNNINLSAPENPTAEDYTERVWDMATNPLDAFYYSVKHGDVSYMPWNYNELMQEGVPTEATQNNIVGSAINTFNPLDAGDKFTRDYREGDYLGAFGNVLRIAPAAQVTNLGKYAGQAGKAISTTLKVPLTVGNKTYPYITPSNALRGYSGVKFTEGVPSTIEAIKKAYESGSDEDIENAIQLTGQSVLNAASVFAPNSKVADLNTSKSAVETTDQLLKSRRAEQAVTEGINTAKALSSLRQVFVKQKGGSIETELTDKEIAYYKKLGYNVDLL